MPDKTFGFTQEQVMMRNSVLALMQRVPPLGNTRELEAQDAYPDEAFQALARGGSLGPPGRRALNWMFHGLTVIPAGILSDRDQGDNGRLMPAGRPIPHGPAGLSPASVIRCIRRRRPW